jgi:KRAB domain-containing zinc finger protein
LTSLTPAKPYRSGTYICWKCGKQFRYLYSLRRHTRKEHEEKRFKCTECLELFATGRDLQAHVVRIHLKEKAFSCPTCKKKFYSQRSTQPTRHRCRIKQYPTFQCTSCGKTFDQMKLLRQHEVKHTQERRYLCSLCGKAFKYRAGLAYHRDTSKCGV